MAQKRDTHAQTVSPSQLDAMACRFAWNLGYKEGYRPRRSSNALEFGTGIHLALEKLYGEGLDPVTEFTAWADKRAAEINPQWDDEVEELRKSKELGIGMLTAYLERYIGPDMLDGDFTVIATEKKLSRRMPIPGGGLSKCRMVVRLDGLVRDNQTGKLFSLEHKTFSRFSLSDLELNQQFTAQVWVGQALADEMGLDEKVVGVIYNGLRKQLAGPRVKLELFERHKVYRTDKQIEVLLQRAYWQYRDMTRKGLPIFPQPNSIRCGQCDFKEVCTEYQRGGDWEFILDTQYTKRGDAKEPEAVVEDDSE